MEEDSPESHHTNTNSLNPSGQLKPGPQTHQHIHSNLQTFHPFPPPQYLQHQRYYTDINNNHASSTRNPSSAPTSSSPTLLVLPPQSQQQQQQQQTQSAAANWANAPVYSSVPQHHHPIAPAPTSTQLGKRTRKGSSTARRNSCLGPPPELEDSYGLQQQQQQQQGNNTGQPAKKQVKRERRESLSMDIGNANTNTNTNTNNTMGGSGAGPSSHHGHDDPMPSTSDFVKKLYKMLEDPAFQNVVSWGPQGDCFVVKDMNEFTKSILPRMFKHSNFASFVRQLNKYDFHKVKNTDDNQFGEQSWTFRHPDFHADRRDALENIKRKVPAQRKNTQQQQQQQAAAAAAVAAASLLSSSPTSFGAAAGFGAGFGGVGVGGGGGFAGTYQTPPTEALASELRRLRDDNEDLKGRLRSLERNYESVLTEMVGFQRGMAQQDNLMQSLIAYFLGSESAKLKAGSGGSPFAGSSGPSGSGGSAGLTSGLPAGLAGITLPSASLASLQAQVQAHAQMHQQQLNATETQLQIAVQQHKVAQAAASGEGENQQQQGQGQYHQQQGQGQGLQQVQRDPSITAHMANMGVHGHEVGRATLMQMSELSRRASANGGGAGNGPVYVPPPPAGVGGGGGGGNSNASGNGLGGWNRGAQGGQGGGLEQQLLQQGMAPPKMTRAEALAKIEEVQREREREREKGRRWSTGTGTGPADVSFGRDMSRERGVDGVDPGVGRALGEKVGGNGNNDMSNNSSSSSSNNNVSAMESSMLHEGLQVYTVGQLMPRGMYPEDSFSVFGAPSNASNSANSSGANWSFDPTGLAGGGLLAGLGIGNMDSPAMASTSGSVASTSRDGEGGDDGVDADGGRLTRARARRAGGSGSGSGSGSNSDEDYEEEEVVRPSQNVTDENGALVAVSSDENAGAGVSKQDGGGAGSGGGGGVLGGGRGILARRRGAKGKGRAGGVGDNDEYMLVLQAAGAQAVSSAGSGSGSGSQKLRVRRSTFVPAWAIPPRVLLVDDDAVSRKLSSKFLQVFGCTTDVAVDGVGAVTKMNLEKYDLVLMDIVMPKLDGVSATSMIRKFDQGTPIISMTSNSKPNEIMTYYSSGMNDILPKPFTKQGLLDVLEKHLIHLKGIQRISKSVPRGPGIPPLSDGGVQQALAAHSREWGVQGLMGGGGNQLMDGAMDPNMSLSLGPLSSSQPSSANPSFNFNFYNDGSGNGGGSGNSPGGNNGPAGGEEVEGLEFEGRMNPLAAMGFSNDQYAVMMQNFLNGEGLGASGSGSGSSGEYSAGSSPASANSSFGMMGQTPATATGLSMGMGMGMGAGGGMGGGTMMYGVGINFGDNSGGTTMNFMKRGLEDGSELEGPAGKKSRFEVIE